MSRFFSKKYSNLEPYTPGEQPANVEKLVKLNTNECPYPPSEKAKAYAAAHTRELNLYSDPLCKELNETLAELYGVDPDEILMNNGSDETLNFAFMAFCDEDHPAVFPNITYGFYPVFAQLNHIPYEEIPLNADFTINVDDYCGIHKTIFIANPNAPTGICLTLEEIERILQSNPDNVVVIDEAYVDFGGTSAVGLIHKYENLLVVQTFSKSRSMAGARLGFGIGCKKLIQDLNTIKYSTNPYNINSMTMAMGIGLLKDNETTLANCEKIKEIRAYTTKVLKEMGFQVLDSSANFVFAMTPDMDGGALYEALKQRGVLVRHFTKPEIAQYNRITIGTKEQMDVLFAALKEILK